LLDAPTRGKPFRTRIAVTADHDDGSDL
jgi:hypothetical protein